MLARFLGCVLAAAASLAAQSLVFHDVRLFDGERVTPRTTVVVTNGRIAAVGPNASAPAGARVIEGAGKTLLPGFIDAHTHTIADTALKQAPVFGVTTTLDMFTHPSMVAAVKKQQAAGGLSDSADLYSSGFLATVPKGHGTEYGMPVPTLTKPEEAQAWVDARVAEGSDYIKIIYDGGRAYGLTIPTLSKETLAALVEAAHKRGKLAVVHIGTLQEAEDAIQSGADGLVHLFTGDHSEPEFGKLAAAHKVFVVPTLSVLCGAATNKQLADDADLKPYLPPAEAANMKRSFKLTIHCNGTDEALRQLHDAHVPLLTGSDVPNPGTTQGATIHGELELLVFGGLTPLEALSAATAAPARAFHLADRGVIAEGKRADLLLVDGDPTADIKATRKIAGVWKAGVPIDRAAWKAGLDAAAAQQSKMKSDPPPAGSESGWVSDFEGEKMEAKFGAGWEASVDGIMGGKSTAKIELASGGAHDSKGALKIAGEILPGFAYPFAGAMFSPGAAQMTPVNLSSKQAVSFWAKGDGKTYRLIVYAKHLGFQPAIQTFAAGPEWKQYRFALSSFSGMDGSDLMALIFCGGPQLGKFEFLIDDVRFE
jgi:imidazolonepropionase-like amidohydrolase